jgi:hypothetical protein
MEEEKPVAVDLPDRDADEPSTAQIVRGRNRRLSKKALALLAEAIDERSARPSTPVHFVRYSSK